MGVLISNTLPARSLALSGSTVECGLKDPSHSARIREAVPFSPTPQCLIRYWDMTLADFKVSSESIAWGAGRVFPATLDLSTSALISLNALITEEGDRDRDSSL
jgi:hypothetical protein